MFLDMEFPGDKASQDPDQLSPAAKINQQKLLLTLAGLLIVILPCSNANLVGGLEYIGNSHPNN